jgi:hypothetical protein
MEGCAQVGGARTGARGGYDAAALCLLAVVCLAVALTVGQYAISNDEEVQHRYGELIVAYYASGFEDRSLFGYRNLYLYGGLFDIAAALLAKLLAYDVYLMRHLMCALIGVGGITATWLTARLVAGPRAGFFAALALATAAPWYGAMFNHTKDIPFAAAMIGGTYFLLRAARGLPRPRWRDTLGLGLMLGAACGLRAMGLLLAGYLGLVILFRLIEIRHAGRAALTGFAAQTGVRFLPGLLLGYAIMLLSWPWAALDPLNPLRAILAFAHFHYQIRTIFAGVIYEMADVPRWYVSAYLLIRTPLPVLAGALLTALPALGRSGGSPDRSSQMRREMALLWFMVIFPVASQALGSGPAFTGMRHFMFVVPPLAVLTGIGFDVAIAWLAARRRLLGSLALGVGVAAFVYEASLLVRLHPYQYVYYNALVGGLAGADRRYSMDYWVAIMPEAVARLEAYLDRDTRDPPGRRFTVGVCGERLSFEHEADARLIWTADWYEADFFIAPTQLNCDRANNGETVVRIERLGVLLGVVKDRRGAMPPHLQR